MLKLFSTNICIFRVTKNVKCPMLFAVTNLVHEMTQAEKALPQHRDLTHSSLGYEEQY